HGELLRALPTPDVLVGAVVETGQPGLQQPGEARADAGDQLGPPGEQLLEIGGIDGVMVDADGAHGGSSLWLFSAGSMCGWVDTPAMCLRCMVDLWAIAGRGRQERWACASWSLGRSRCMRTGKSCPDWRHGTGPSSRTCCCTPAPLSAPSGCPPRCGA